MANDKSSHERDEPAKPDTPSKKPSSPVDERKQAKPNPLALIRDAVKSWGSKLTGSDDIDLQDEEPYSPSPSRTGSVDTVKAKPSEQATSAKQPARQPQSTDTKPIGPFDPPPYQRYLKPFFCRDHGCPPRLADFMVDTEEEKLLSCLFHPAIGNDHTLRDEKNDPMTTEKRLLARNDFSRMEWWKNRYLRCAKESCYPKHHWSNCPYPCVWCKSSYHGYKRCDNPNFQIIPKVYNHYEGPAPEPEIPAFANPAGTFPSALKGKSAENEPHPPISMPKTTLVSKRGLHREYTDREDEDGTLDGRVMTQLKQLHRDTFETNQQNVSIQRYLVSIDKRIWSLQKTADTNTDVLRKWHRLFSENHHSRLDVLDACAKSLGLSINQNAPSPHERYGYTPSIVVSGPGDDPTSTIVHPETQLDVPSASGTHEVEAQIEANLQALKALQNLEATLTRFTDSIVSSKRTDSLTSVQETSISDSATQTSATQGTFQVTSLGPKPSTVQDLLTAQETSSNQDSSDSKGRYSAPNPLPVPRTPQLRPAVTVRELTTDELSSGDDAGPSSMQREKSGNTKGKAEVRTESSSGSLAQPPPSIPGLFLDHDDNNSSNSDDTITQEEFTSLDTTGATSAYQIRQSSRTRQDSTPVSPTEITPADHVDDVAIAEYFSQMQVEDMLRYMSKYEIAAMYYAGDLEAWNKEYLGSGSGV